MLPLTQQQITSTLLTATGQIHHLTLALQLMYYTGSRQSEVAQCPKLSFYFVPSQGALPIKLCTRKLLHAPSQYIAMINGSKNVLTPGAHLLNTCTRHWKFARRVQGAPLISDTVAPPSATAYDQLRHVTKQDVHVSNNNLIINSKWSKTMQAFDQNRALTIPMAEDPRLCVIRSYRAHLQAAPTRYQGQPLLVFPDTYKPVTTSWLTARFRDIIKILDLEPANHSLHSLRRSAATNAYHQDCDHLQVQRFGAWSSEAYRPYVTQKGANQVTAHHVQNTWLYLRLSFNPPTHIRFYKFTHLIKSSHIWVWYVHLLLKLLYIVNVYHKIKLHP